MVIDMRLRPPIPAWTSGTVFKNTMYFPRNHSTFRAARSAWLESFDMLIDEMDSAGVVYGVVVGRSTVSAGEMGSVPNQAIVDLLASESRFVGFLSLDLDNFDASIAELRALVGETGVKGISLEPSTAREPLDADDDRLDPVYELAIARNLPVSITLSALLAAYARRDIGTVHPAQLQRLSFKFPELTIIAAHAAWPYTREMVAIASVCGNIYVSPDLYLSTPHMPGVEDYVAGANLFLEDRMLFGSGYPVRDLQDAIDECGSLNWRPGVRDKVLYKNASKLLALDSRAH